MPAYIKDSLVEAGLGSSSIPEPLTGSILLGLGFFCHLLCFKVFENENPRIFLIDKGTGSLMTKVLSDICYIIVSL